MDISRYELLLLIVVITVKLGICSFRIESVWKPVTLDLTLKTLTSISFDEKVPSLLVNTSSEIGCILVCKRHSKSCIWIRYSIKTRTCRGYFESGQSVDNMNSWTLAQELPCRLQGYFFNMVFQRCIRLYREIAVTWFEAETSCRKDNAYILITDSLEKIIEYDTIAKYSAGWVGLSDHSSDGPGRDFRWMNGNSLSDTSPLWGPHQPKNDLCVDVGIFDGGLNDRDCYERLPFACQEII